VLRASAAVLVPSGKGVNVSRVLHANGIATTAVLVVGGPEGDALVAALRAEGLEVVEVPVADRVRSNVTLLEPDGTATKVNEPGPDLRPAEVEALLAAAVGVVRRTPTSWLVGSGSLPPGAPVDFYARLVVASRAGLEVAESEVAESAVRVAVDATGAALVAAVEAGADLVAPNTDELSELTGTRLRTVGDVAAAARELLDRGAGAVLASMGADGAVFVTADDAWWAGVGVTTLVSSVGAGDTLLAGFLAGGGPEDPARSLGTAAALATRRCELPPTEQPLLASLAGRTSDSATMLGPSLRHRPLSDTGHSVNRPAEPAG